MVVLRWRDRVLGRVFAPVADGAVAPDTLTRLVDERLRHDMLDGWLDATLGFDERAVLAPMPLTAAVAICTRERPADLTIALRAVTALEPAPTEVIVVDNAPRTAQTRDVVAAFPAVRYVLEPGQGLDRARNRALAEARTDVVAFTDDDAAPDRGWLGALLANFQDARVVCATGLTLPAALDTQAQETFERNCSFVRGFRRRVFDGQHDNPFAVGQVGAGANMAVRRAAVLGLGAFDPRLDAGTPTCSGGDHELFVRILSAGHRIVYEPQAVSWHRHRRSMDELMSTVRGYGVGVYAMWTKLLVEHREVGVLRQAWRWLVKTQLPDVLAVRSPARRRLARAELRGCFAGPRAWWAAHRRQESSHV